ncbi:MAG: hypothetical protein NTU54_03145 [Candidatus Omnitrophica bacterium]|nr:hypothetical protein [Candidatus Omnitrophota bacterium]
MPPYLKRLSGYNFLFDFDNTITPFDVLDDIIEKFSVNDDWVVYEEAWRAGFANRIGFDKDRLVPFFPHQHDACPCCANCKTRHLTKYSSAGNIVVYIGDGLSDTCAAQNASLVFAKGHLLEYLRKKGVSCTAFENLGDIQRYLGEVIDNGTEDKARQKAGKA